ncbi:MAG: signal peptide peptidase SppA [Bacteroidales bacterium]|nr:MAG: signal peptide peptidase SppA [Bacteroidales bacterium]
MKTFFKYLLASILGFIIASFLCLLILIGIVGGMMASSDKLVEVKDNSILYINLNKEIVDRSSNNPFNGFDFESLQPRTSLGLNNILKAIENAKDDPKIKGIFMEVDAVNAGAATVNEIRNALIDFKASGKFIISYNDLYGQKAYFLSSVADKIYLNPEGAVAWTGLRAEVMYYKNILEKIGIEPQIIRHGKFKSAVEPYMLDKMSSENREQISTFIGSIWNHWVDEISKSRNISNAELNRFADEMMIRNGKTTLENKLVDSLIYKDQVIDILKKKLGVSDKKDIPSVSLEDYAKLPTPLKGKGLSKNKIAVIYASGEINIGNATDGAIGSDGISKVIREARRDSTIKAIVLRVNSPGGSALASEVIWRELVLAKKVKPVIVSMGDVAASGGYYISAPADTILADPTTITGSIGVFGILFNVKNVLSNKLGINVETVSTNKHSDFGSMYRPLTAEERAVVQLSIEDIYQTFIGHVSEGRNIPIARVDEIGQGRVWSGVNAKNIKLIDGFGGLKDAINVAVKKAKLDDYRITELPKQKEPFEQIIEELTGKAKVSILRDELGVAYKHYNNIMNMLSNQGIQARIPYNVELY